MDDSFGHWLAGFVDGEGCFTICRVSGRNSDVGNGIIRTWPNCRFEISIRADDAEIIYTIQDTLGMGNVNAKFPSPSARPNAQPAVIYRVGRIDHCLRIVELFTKYPLRAKKAAQFDIWAEAVHEMSKGRDRNDAIVDDCKARLTALRTYVAPANLAAIRDRNPEPFKHRRDYGTPPPCLCGCGGVTKILSNPKGGITHPENPNYSCFMRGHYSRRVLARIAADL